MKIIGVKRNVDDLGRIIIPKEMRNEVGLKASEPFEALLGELDGEKVIVIRKPNDETILNLKSNESDLRV